MTRLRTILITALLLSCASAQADWSANIGYASEYYYRGFFQKSSSASGGIDFEQGGFFAGTWAADVGDGLEVDGYFGYSGQIDENISYGVGFTGYYYTGDFDDTYQEVNLSGGFQFFTVDVAIGEYDNFDGPTLDYVYYALTAEHKGFYGKYAGFSEDFDGNYFEVGYGLTVLDEVDLGIVAIFSDSDLAGESDEAILFTIGKTFDLN